MNNKLILLLIISTILVLFLFGCSTEQQILLNEDDFEIKSLEYYSVDSKTNSGEVRLVVYTKVDNLRISAISEEGYCVGECKIAGECKLNTCRGGDGGKSITSFTIQNITKDNVFNICIISKNKVCKEFLLPAYYDENSDVKEPEQTDNSKDEKKLIPKDQGLIDQYFCNTNSDCEIKDIGSCCGEYPRCVNKEFIPDIDAVINECKESGISSTCEFPVIIYCACIKNSCVSNDNPFTLIDPIAIE